ncbi:hypothetical protein GCM10028821_41380 [Hymenobacter jeollabukensis]
MHCSLLPMNPRPLLVALPLLAACTGPAEKAAPPAAPVAVVAPDTVAPPVLSAVELARQRVHEKQEAEVRARQDTTNQLNAVIQVRYPQFRVLDFVSGDINADGRRDIVVVVETRCIPLPGFDTTTYRRRMALLLLRDGAARLRIGAVNEHGLVNNVRCYHDTYEGYEYVNIQARTFTFHGSQPHTGYEAVFRYDKKRRDWFLYRRIRTDYVIDAYHEQRETPRNFGRVRFADYDGGLMEF